MNKPLPPLSKQFGQFTLWHVVVIILVFVGLALYFNSRGTGFITQTIPNSLGFTRYDNTDLNDSQNRRSINYSNTNSEPTVSMASYSQQPEDTDADTLVTEPAVVQQAPVQQQTQRPRRAQAQQTEPYNDNLYEPSTHKPINSYDQEFPPRLDRGYYTVQMFTGYNSKQAYDLRAALKKDGYSGTHIREVRTSKGVLFKVRIGHYKARYEAFAVRDQIRRRYPKTLDTSFVILVEREYN